MKSTVMIKYLHFCIFIHCFWSFYIWYFLLLNFWCFNGQNFQHIFPPISDNSSFSFSIFSSYVSCTNSTSMPLSLFYNGLVSRPLFVFLHLCDHYFYWTSKISSFPLSFTTSRTLFFLTNFWTKSNPVYSQNVSTNL